MGDASSENHASGSASHYRSYGFDLCPGGPGSCERCKQVATLYFGDRDFYDSREGTYLCGDCLDCRIAADKEFAEYVDEMVENQLNHEASHMPWLL